MRKLAVILAVSMAMSVGTAAFAAEATYSDSNNSVTTDANGYSTVLITKGTEAFSGDESDVVYIANNNSGFGASIEFLLKEDATPGDYRVLLGGTSGAPKSMTFTIGSQTTTRDVAMSNLGYEQGSLENTINMAFAVDAADMSKYNAIKIVIDENTESPQYGGFLINDVFDTTLEGNVNLGLQINNIPNAYLDRISVYLSNGTTSGELKSWNQE